MGSYCSKRLIFGVKSSQDVFDDAMYKVFGDIQHYRDQRNDILLGGRDNKEHPQVLQTVLQRANEHGITFDKEKCEFEKEEIEFIFFRHVFTKDGLKPLPDKVKEIKEHPREKKE